MLLIYKKWFFIYNSLIDGWKVKLINKNKFEFIKDNDKIKKEINLNSFILNNLNIENFNIENFNI